jgi:hypothetical protein
MQLVIIIVIIIFIIMYNATKAPACLSTVILGTFQFAENAILKTKKQQGSRLRCWLTTTLATRNMNKNKHKNKNKAILSVARYYIPASPAATR